jgi:CDGSH-type Zn-finger protein
VIIGGETKHICGCGLSNTQPFCNGTHKISREEDPNKLYWYDEQGNRFETSAAREQWQTESQSQACCCRDMFQLI